MLMNTEIKNQIILNKKIEKIKTSYVYLINYKNKKTNDLKALKK